MGLDGLDRLDRLDRFRVCGSDAQLPEIPQVDPPAATTEVEFASADGVFFASADGAIFASAS